MKNGCIFKGINSRTDVGVVMRSINRLVLPSATRSTANVPGRPGAVDFETDTYVEGEISVNFSWKSLRPADSALKGETLSGWLHNDGKYHELIFEDSPNRKYYAKVAAAVPMTPAPCVGSVSVTFVINPPYAFALDNSPVSPEDVEQRLLWDTATLIGSEYTQTFYSSGNMRFTIAGTSPVRPIIKILGKVPAGFKLMCQSQEWQYNAVLNWDGIKIDCDNESTTRMSDGANLFQNTAPNDYFNLSPGQVAMSVSGALGVFPASVTVIINLSPAYGG